VTYASMIMKNHLNTNVLALYLLMDTASRSSTNLAAANGGTNPSHAALPTNSGWLACPPIEGLL
jgi:hypothetical protein